MNNDQVAKKAALVFPQLGGNYEVHISSVVGLERSAFQKGAEWLAGLEPDDTGSVLQKAQQQLNPSIIDPMLYKLADILKALGYVLIKLP